MHNAPSAALRKVNTVNSYFLSMNRHAREAVRGTSRN